MEKGKRLLDAWKLVIDLARLKSHGEYDHEDVMAVIASQETVDAAEVVRCKDCKHYMTIHCTCDGCCISDDWYCADGERKENERKAD